MTEPKTYEVKRTVVEIYEIKAKSKKEALEYIGTYGNPSKVIIKSETAKVKL